METIWANAAWPAEHVALRLRLRPYSCGHEINLCQIQSPFVLGGESDWNDFFAAVLLCSQTFEQGQILIRKPWKVRNFARIWSLLLRIRWRAEMFHVELQKFRGYLNTGSWAPETNTVLARGVEMRTFKAPRAYRLIPFLCAQLGMTEAQALDFPLARANAYYAALADKAGEIDLSGGDEETGLLKHLAELEERERKGENVWEF